MYGNFFDEAIERDFGGVTEWNDDVLVSNAVYETFPLYREFPILNQTIILLLGDVTIEQISDDCWKVTLTYDLPTQENGGGFGGPLAENYKDWGLGPDADENGGAGWTEELTQLSFNSSVREVHKTTSIKLAHSSKASWLPAAIDIPDNMVIEHPAPVGFTEDKIEGYSGYDREFTFQITKYMSPQQLKYAYIRRIHSMAATINRDVFFGFPPLSVMFMGSSGVGDLIQNVPVTFEFSVKPNFQFIDSTVTTLADPDVDDPAEMYDKLADPGFPGTPPDIIYSGWAHVEYRYIPLPDPAAKIKVMTPAFRFIHSITHNSDFTKLRI